MDSKVQLPIYEIKVNNILNCGYHEMLKIVVVVVFVNIFMMVRNRIFWLLQACKLKFGASLLHEKSNWKYAKQSYAWISFENKYAEKFSVLNHAINFLGFNT